MAKIKHTKHFAADFSPIRFIKHEDLNETTIMLIDISRVCSLVNCVLLSTSKFQKRHFVGIDLKSTSIYLMLKVRVMVKIKFDTIKLNKTNIDL